LDIGGTTQSEAAFYLARQPIMGRDQELVAYELLFRGGPARAGRSAAPEIFDDTAATASVIQHTLYDLGLAQALGGRLGFVNVSEPLLMSGLIETLPPASIALEILETVRLTPEIISRCADLKQAGYVLALDDVVELTPAHEKILPFVSIVKIDLPGMPPEKLASTVRTLRRHQVKLLAEKVETLDEFQLYHSLGFDLFQGYFFAKPTLLTGKTVTPATMALVRLTCLIAADADTEALEEELKQAPDLVMRLLKMANSAAFNPTEKKITSLHNAIMVMGRKELSRLAQIIIFTKQSRLDLDVDPMVQLAATRGYMMEGLAKMLGWARMKDNAFMVGMLSLADTLFGMPIAEIARLFNLDDSLRDALCDHAGPLGQLLHLVKLNESADFDGVQKLLTPLSAIDTTQFNRLLVDSLAWAAKL
jgi:EAL and modified HD-GYP domain-containing signal transduction protein